MGRHSVGTPEVEKIWGTVQICYMKDMPAPIAPKTALCYKVVGKRGWEPVLIEPLSFMNDSGKTFVVRGFTVAVPEGSFYYPLTVAHSIAPTNTLTVYHNYSARDLHGNNL